MTLQIKELAAKPDDLSLIPGPWSTSPELTPVSCPLTSTFLPHHVNGSAQNHIAKSYFRETCKSLRKAGCIQS